MVAGEYRPTQTLKLTAAATLDALISTEASESGKAMQLGERQFTDGTTRPVYRSSVGRLFLLDDDGELVYLVWLHPDKYQEPVIFDGGTELSF